VKLNPGTPWQKQEGEYTHQKNGLKCKEDSNKCFIWSKAFYGAENLTLW
jgi:hypothetical protein